MMNVAVERVSMNYVHCDGYIITECTLILVFDNCVGQNKSKDVFLFFAILSMTFFDRVVILFLISGHSHMLPDRVVGWLRKILHGVNLFSPVELVAMFQNLKSVSAEYIDLNDAERCMFDGWSELLQSCGMNSIPSDFAYTQYHWFEFKDGYMHAKPFADSEENTTKEHIFTQSPEEVSKTFVEELTSRDSLMESNVKDITLERLNFKSPLSKAKLKSITKSLETIPAEYHHLYPQYDHANDTEDEKRQWEAAKEKEKQIRLPSDISMQVAKACARTTGMSKAEKQSIAKPHTLNPLTTPRVTNPISTFLDKFNFFGRGKKPCPPAAEHDNASTLSPVSAMSSLLNTSPESCEAPSTAMADSDITVEMPCNPAPSFQNVDEDDNEEYREEDKGKTWWGESKGDEPNMKTCSSALHTPRSMVMEGSEPVAIPTREWIVLTNDERNEYSYMVGGNKTSTDPLFQHAFYANVVFTRAKMACLAPGEQLNDEVINLYMAILGKKFPNNHYFSTFFMEKLLGDKDRIKGYKFSNVQRWTKGFRIEDKQQVYIPINILNSHWTLLVIDFQSTSSGAGATITYADSLGGGGREYTDAIQRCLRDERQSRGEAPCTRSWTVRVGMKPTQRNKFDCGVYVIMMTDLLSHGLKIHSLNDNVMNDHRQRITIMLKEGNLRY